MSMPPPPPPPSAPPPSGYAGPTTPVPQQPGPYGYLPMSSDEPPPLRRPPGVDATANVLGAIGGLVVTALATGVMLHASAKLASRYTLFGEARVADILLLLVSVAMFGAVIIGGRFAPAGPIVPGVALAAFGLAGLLSFDFSSWLFRNYPIERDARGLIGWISLGAFVVIGGLMVGSGIASALPRRR